ncbi:MAG: hypothetical protein JSV54_09255 [Chloroflexota bacterium]|nr:MAG: hypothetical protein JSV54_09255 [Chloroflexota bacterium]
MNRDQIAELDRLRPYLLKKFEGWIRQQRKIHLANARPLSSQEKSRLDGYFEKRILDKARLASVKKISNPEFYDDFKNSGITIPLDFSTAIGMALVDCIIIHKEIWADPSSLISTIFHEMVHVVQFDILGLKKHIELYSDSLRQNNYQYNNVILERQAYNLSNKFDRGKPPFSVSDAVREDLKHAGYL